jgi:hypothetical protein
MFLDCLLGTAPVGLDGFFKCLFGRMRPSLMNWRHDYAMLIIVNRYENMGLF